MPTQITATADPGKALYAVITDSSNYVYRTDTHAFEPEDDANYAFYAVALTETSAGNYAADFPAQIGAGEYSYSVREVGQVYPAISPANASINSTQPTRFTVVGLPPSVSITGWDSESGEISYSPGGTSPFQDILSTGTFADGDQDALYVSLSDGSTITVALGLNSQLDPGTPVPPPPGYAPSGTTLSTAAVTIAPTTVPYVRRSRLETPMTVKLASTPAILFLLLSSTDHVTPLTGAAPTTELSKAGAAFAAPVGVVTEVGLGWYKLTPTSADTNTLGTLVLHATAAGADPASVTAEIVAYDPADAAALGLSRFDATVSSRLAETDYAAPVAAPTASAVAAAVITAIKADTILAATFNRAEGKYTYNPATHVMTLLNDDGSSAGTVTLSVDSTSGVITGKQ